MQWRGFHFAIDTKDNYFFSILNSSFISTSRSSAILTNVSIGGWQELVHHLLTVVGAHSSCSDNPLFVLFLSARTTLILFSILLQMSYTLLYNNTRTKQIFHEIKKKKSIFLQNTANFIPFASLLFLVDTIFVCLTTKSRLTTKSCQYWQILVMTRFCHFRIPYPT